jgi:protein-S-isoprenylcysteine O-methyltransferase
MTLHQLFLALCIVWPLSEFWIGARHRSGKRNEVRDQGTLRLLILTIGLCVALAVWLGYCGPDYWPASAMSTAWRQPLLFAGCALMAAGMPLRWWSVRTLAQFFTIDVAIREGHRLIRSGPYRLLRHPSYTGALMTYWGFALALGNWLALAVVIVPVTAAFLWRMRIEERVLADAFPADYPAYSRETKRLIPFLW